MPRPIDGKAMRSIAVRLRSAFDLAIHVKTYFVLFIMVSLRATNVSEWSAILFSLLLIYFKRILREC